MPNKISLFYLIAIIIVKFFPLQIHAQNPERSSSPENDDGVLTITVKDRWNKPVVGAEVYLMTGFEEVHFESLFSDDLGEKQKFDPDRLRELPVKRTNQNGQVEFADLRWPKKYFVYLETEDGVHQTGYSLMKQRLDKEVRLAYSNVRVVFPVKEAGPLFSYIILQNEYGDIVFFSEGNLMDADTLEPYYEYNILSLEDGVYNGKIEMRGILKPSDISTHDIQKEIRLLTLEDKFTFEVDGVLNRKIVIDKQQNILEVRVTDHDANPIENAKVTLEYMYGVTGYNFEATTNEMGTSIFENLPQGNLMAVAEYDGYVSEMNFVRIPDSEYNHNSLDIQLQTLGKGELIVSFVNQESSEAVRNINSSEFEIIRRDFDSEDVGAFVEFTPEQIEKGKFFYDDIPAGEYSFFGFSDSVPWQLYHDHLSSNEVSKKLENEDYKKWIDINSNETGILEIALTNKSVLHVSIGSDDLDEWMKHYEKMVLEDYDPYEGREIILLKADNEIEPVEEGEGFCKFPFLTEGNYTLKDLKDGEVINQIELLIGIGESHRQIFPFETDE